MGFWCQTAVPAPDYKKTRPFRPQGRITLVQGRTGMLLARPAGGSNFEEDQLLQTFTIISTTIPARLRSQLYVVDCRFPLLSHGCAFDVAR